jgi:hypothetical protein
MKTKLSYWSNLITQMFLVRNLLENPPKSNQSKQDYKTRFVRKLDIDGPSDILRKIKFVLSSIECIIICFRVVVVVVLLLFFFIILLALYLPCSRCKMPSRTFIQYCYQVSSVKPVV